MTSMRSHHGLVPPLTLTLVLLMTGCPGDDSSPMDTDTDTEGTTGTSTSTSTTTTTTTGSSTSTDGSSSSTTEMVDDTSTTDDTTTGPLPPDGVCIGIDQIGDIGTVFTMGGGPPPMCDATPMPCGGDVVGTWDVDVSCGYDSVPNPLEKVCPGSTYELNVVGQSGTIAFEMDNTFTQDFNIEVEVVLTLDTMACLGVDCAAFNMEVQMDDPMASCVDAMGMCACTFPPEPPEPPVMGTYETMGDQLILDVDGDVTALDYCVNGGRLDVWNPLFDFTLTETLCEDEMDCVDELGEMHEFYVCDSLKEEAPAQKGLRPRIARPTLPSWITGG